MDGDFEVLHFAASSDQVVKEAPQRAVLYR